MNNVQPVCGNMEPHEFHFHEWMDHHFKMHQKWCDGICEWCFRDGVPDNKPLHGNGRHK